MVESLAAGAADLPNMLMNRSTPPNPFVAFLTGSVGTLQLEGVKLSAATSRINAREMRFMALFVWFLLVLCSPANLAPQQAAVCQNRVGRMSKGCHGKEGGDRLLPVAQCDGGRT